MKKSLLSATMLLMLCTSVWGIEQSIEYSNDVFVAGENGYHTYRIPALAVSNSGTILAFCEGRKLKRSDTGDIDLLLKRSTDAGKSWSGQIIIWDDDDNTCGNPCPIVIPETGRIVLLMTWNLGEDVEKMIYAGTSKDTRRVFVTYSDDDGINWSSPKEITEDVKLPEWGWYATGPGGGIRIERGKYAGRLVVPCDHSELKTEYTYSHCIFSDDNGETWKLGEQTDPMVNECQVVELSGVRLMLNMRNYDDSRKCRQTALSYDGGLTWKEQKFDTVLVEPRCEASIEGFSWNEDGSRKLLIFTNPAGITRANMSLRLSYDEGKSWNSTLVLYESESAYSDLAVLADKNIGCLFEMGEKNPYESIKFVSISVKDLSTKIPD